MVIKGYTSAINLRAQPPGRAKQSLSGTLTAARALPDPELIEICEYGLEWVSTYIERRAKRRIQRLARSDGEARRLDRAVDNFIGDIVRALERAPGRYPHHPERHRWAAELKATYFPDGAFAITALPYEEELVVAEYVHHHLTTEHADWCRALRIDGLLEDLGEVLPAYREALTPDDPISVDAVNEAFDRMQHALCAAMAHVYGRYWRETDTDKRTQLVRAIVDQDRRMAELYAARRRGESNVEAEVEADLPLEQAEGAEPDAELDAELDALDAFDAGADGEAPAAPEAPEAAAPEADPPVLRPLPGDDR